MNSNALIVGLDLGTTHCKAAAFDSSGTEVSRAEVPITTYRPRPGWHEQDADEWFQAVVNILRDLAQDLGPRVKSVKAISLAAHGPSLVLVDQDLKPLSRCQIWQDQRGANYLSDLVRHIGHDWIGKGLPQAGFPLKLAWSLENQPDAVKNAGFILGTKSYLVAKLTGQILDDPTSCLPSGTWQQEVFDYLGVNIAKLPQVVQSESSAGPLLGDIVHHTGLPENLIVVTGLSDAAAACLGAGLASVGQGIITLGTNGVARCVVPKRIPGETLLELSMFCYPYVNDLFITGGYCRGGGDNVLWFLETVYNRSEISDEELILFAEEVEQSPIGARGVTYLPLLLGRGTPKSDDTPRAAFLGLARHHTRSDLARSVLEGVAFALNDISIVFKNLGLTWQDVRLTGGGANIQPWRRILANTLDRSIKWMPGDSLLGAAMVGALAIGHYDTYDEVIEKMTSVAEVIHPQADPTKQYMNRYKDYIKYREALFK